jgi:hypothetical protein
LLQPDLVGCAAACSATDTLGSFTCPSSPQMTITPHRAALEYGDEADGTSADAVAHEPGCVKRVRIKNR